MTLRSCNSWDGHELQLAATGEHLIVYTHNPHAKGCHAGMINQIASLTNPPSGRSHDSRLSVEYTGRVKPNLGKFPWLRVVDSGGIHPNGSCCGSWSTLWITLWITIPCCQRVFW